MQDPTDMDALLDWVNEVRKAHEPREGFCDHFDDLADGRVLLGVMHDVSPRCFPELGSIYLTKLLEGLVAHFRAQPDRGSEGGRLAQQFLEGCVRGAGCPEVGRLVQLVIWASFNPPEHHEYIAVCEELRRRNPSFENALNDIIEHFKPDSDLDFNGHTLGDVSTTDSSDDFLNPAVDIQTRFARLTQAYDKVMQEREQEREQWHRVTHEREHEKEQWQTRLRAAEEAQREAREGLDAAHEDQHKVQKVQEDERVSLEQRHETALRRRDEDIADLREKLDSKEKQAEQTARLELQLADARKKIEDLREKQKESGELTARLERQQEGPDLGALEHQRSRLERMKSQLEAVNEEREEEQKQVQMLQFELGDERNAREEAADEASRYRRELVELAAASGSGPVTHAATSAAAAAAAAAAVVRQSPRVGMSGEVFSELPSGGNEIQRLYQQWLDEKDRSLLEEKERTKTAEASLQTQRAESLKLAERRASDEARAAALEERLRSEAAQLKELRDLHGTPGPTPRGAPPGAIPAGVAAGVAAERALQAQLAQRERELQVALHRGQIDSHHLVVQEGLMASSFHALGLRYHRLLAQRDQLLHRVRDLEQRSGSGSA